MVRTCYCQRCRMDTEEADLVVNHRPLCDPDCIKRARSERQQLRRREIATRMVGAGFNAA